MRMHETSLPRLERLPDFCSLPVVFAMLLVAALAVAVMALTPGAAFGWRGFSTAVAFAAWLALLNAVALCTARPLLLRLPGVAAFAGVWLVIVLIAFAGSAVVGRLDHALDMRLTPDSTLRFVAASSAISALIGAALLRYFHVVAQWQARQAASTRARVEALQARIQPHFLFNSMNTVAALVRVDPAAAESTVENLSELFRAALGSDGISTLGEELALVDRYLAIEGWRLGGRLHVERDLGGLPPSMPMPRLLLQPLVENAVRHGIQARRGGGTIHLSGHVAGDAVTLCIGNPLPDPGATSTGGHGHGLDNVRQRLAYHFGPRSRLDAGVHGDRFLVRLDLPWKPSPGHHAGPPGGTDAHPDR